MSHFRAAYSIWFYLEHLKNKNCPIQVNLIRFLSLNDYVFIKTRYLHQRDVFRGKDADLVYCPILEETFHFNPKLGSKLFSFTLQQAELIHDACSAGVMSLRRVVQMIKLIKIPVS